MVKKGYPPVLQVEGESLPDSWQKTIFAIADRGYVFRRDDPEDSGDQLECRMTTIVNNPDSDPFTHLMGGTNATDSALLDYYYEMMGAKKGWCRNPNDPADTKWQYTYYDCLASYPGAEKDEKIDQIAWAVKRLQTRPFSRRTNLITWWPPRDTVEKDTPCLQRITFGIVPGGLDMQYEFRSRNTGYASFGNMQGLYMMGCNVRDQVEESTGKPLDLRMIDTTNSYHVNSREYPGFLKRIKDLKRRIEQGGRTTLTRAETVEGLSACRVEVEDNIMQQTAKHLNPQEIPGERERVYKVGERIFYLLDKYGKRAQKSE